MKGMFHVAAGGLCAMALAAVPATAQSGSFSSHSRSGGFTARPPQFGCIGGGSFVFDGHNNDGRRDHRRSRSDVCRSDTVMDVYGGEWALYNNRTWEADSYNDWWHDRPDRAYPAWMRRNQGCARPWYSGDTLTC
jgi:hypothetical protein